MSIHKNYGSLLGASIISGIFSIWIIIAGANFLADERNYSFLHYKPDPEFIIGVGAQTLFASVLGCNASVKRKRGARIGYNIFATIGLGLSTAYFIWGIDLGTFFWIPFVIMIAIITGLTNSGVISKKQQKHEYKKAKKAAAAYIPVQQGQQYQYPNAPAAGGVPYQYQPPQYQPVQPGQQYYQAPPQQYQQQQQQYQQPGYYAPPPQEIPVEQQQPMMGGQQQNQYYPTPPPLPQN